MKVIKDNYHKSNDESNITCDYCGSELKFEESDVYYGEHGLGKIECPLCGYASYVDGYEIKLTQDNVNYPEHYCHLYVTEDSDLHIDERIIDEKINQDVKKCIDYLITHNDEYFYYIEGKYFVLVYRSDDVGFSVVVSKDFYTTLVEK